MRAINRIVSAMAVLIFGSILSAADQDKPNIVLVLADDLGVNDLGCMGSDYHESPRIDRLASEGVRFVNAYSACANCTPSRACLISGQYVPRHGVYTVGSRDRFRWQEFPLVPPENADGLEPGIPTVASLLSGSGYLSTMIGKWHVNRQGLYSEERRPELYGFTSAEVLCNGKHDGARMRDGDNPVPGGAFLSDHLANRAIAAIDSAAGSPFFIMISDFIVHVPYQAPSDLIAKYRNKRPGKLHGKREFSATYAAMIERLDYNVGRVLDHLEKRRLSSNTLVLFTSDNGAVYGNEPYAGGKGCLTEGGIRVPMIARWPGHIPAGQLCNVPVHGVDILPTLCGVAGTPLPKDRPFDGEDLMPVMSGVAKTTSRTDLFWYMPGYLPGRQDPAAVMRSGSWKLRHDFTSDQFHLFDLANDPGETRDVAAQEPNRAGEMKNRLDAWRSAIGASIPQRNTSPKLIDRSGKRDRVGVEFRGDD